MKDNYILEKYEYHVNIKVEFSSPYGSVSLDTLP